jgi:hypothetical protein
MFAGGHSPVSAYALTLGNLRRRIADCLQCDSLQFLIFSIPTDIPIAHHCSGFCRLARKVNTSCRWQKEGSLSSSRLPKRRVSPVSRGVLPTPALRCLQKFLRQPRSKVSNLRIVARRNRIDFRIRNTFPSVQLTFPQEFASCLITPSVLVSLNWADSWERKRILGRSPGGKDYAHTR